MHKMRYVLCCVTDSYSLANHVVFGTLCFIRSKGTPHWRGPPAGAILQACWHWCGSGQE
jgi:hypothetical protein